MKIQTGRGTIPLITLIAIWSISALTSLPGLAVSPILGDLTKIFPKATDLDIQMLTSLPSLLIIPFILLGGKLTEKVDYVRVLKVGLWLFAASGILYLISNRMWQLIVVSALLGIGSGLIIPLSTGLVSRYFVGTYRVKQFGLSSAITNFTLVIATAVTGYLAEVSWHLPFLVYLLPLISILLVGHLKEDRTGEAALHASPSSDTAILRGKCSNCEAARECETSATTASCRQSAIDIGGSKYGIHIKHLIELMLFYGVITYIVIVVIFNLPFLMEKHHFLQWQFRTDDFAFLPGHHRSGLLSGQDCRPAERTYESIQPAVDGIGTIVNLDSSDRVVDYSRMYPGWFRVWHYPTYAL